MRKFEDFPIRNEAGRFIVNPFWLEHLLNLFYQGYIGEVWEEIMDTKIQKDKTIENIGYGIIEENYDVKHYPIAVKGEVKWNT